MNETLPISFHFFFFFFYCFVSKLHQQSLRFPWTSLHPVFMWRTYTVFVVA